MDENPASVDHICLFLVLLLHSEESDWYTVHRKQKRTCGYNSTWWVFRLRLTLASATTTLNTGWPVIFVLLPLPLLRLACGGDVIFYCRPKVQRVHNMRTWWPDKKSQNQYRWSFVLEISFQLQWLVLGCEMLLSTFIHNYSLDNNVISRWR